MAIVTVQELQNAAADAQTLEDVVNGPASPGTLSSRQGRSLKTLARMQQDAAAAVGSITSVQEQWPLMRMSPNMNCVMHATSAALNGWSHGSGVTVSHVRTISSGVAFSARPSDDQAFLQALGTTATHFQPSINIVSVAWTGKSVGSYLLFPGSVPFSGWATAGCIGKIISGNAYGQFAAGMTTAWSLCGTNVGPTANGYWNCHPYAGSAAGEIHIALAGVCHGRRPIDSANPRWGWLPAPYGTHDSDFTA